MTQSQLIRANQLSSQIAHLDEVYSQLFNFTTAKFSKVVLIQNTFDGVVPDIPIEFVEIDIIKIMDSMHVKIASLKKEFNEL